MSRSIAKLKDARTLRTITFPVARAGPIFQEAMAYTSKSQSADSCMPPTFSSLEGNSTGRFDPGKNVSRLIIRECPELSYNDAIRFMPRVGELSFVCLGVHNQIVSFTSSHRMAHNHFRLTSIVLP